MNLVGRIPPKTCWDYIEKISKSPEKEILVLRFGPQNNDEVKDFLFFYVSVESCFTDNKNQLLQVSAYESFFEYLSTRGRLGVVGNANKMVERQLESSPVKKLFSQVKDCYIMPLGKDQEVPAALLPLEGQGLPHNRPNLLLSILVCNLRSREHVYNKIYNNFF